jgi:hypothetical protein
MRRSNVERSGLSLAQTRAIGRMTINFNWMEHCLEVLLKFLVTADNPDLVHLILKPMMFRAKLSLLRKLVDAVAEHYVPTTENKAAYAEFKSKLKQIMSDAEKLNDFRNSVIHWRPFLNSRYNKQRPMAASAPTINDKATEMNEIGLRRLPEMTP